MNPIPLPFERDSHDLCSSLLRKPEAENPEEWLVVLLTISDAYYSFHFLYYCKPMAMRGNDKYTHIYNPHTYRLLPCYFMSAHENC